MTEGRAFDAYKMLQSFRRETYVGTTSSLDWMRFTPACSMFFHAAASEPLRIDASARVLDYVGVEAELARIHRRPGDAEIGREPGNEDASDAAPREVAVKPGLELAVGLDEGGIAVDLRVVAFADHELGMRDIAPQSADGDRDLARARGAEVRGWVADDVKVARSSRSSRKAVRLPSCRP